MRIRQIVVIVEVEISPGNECVSMRCEVRDTRLCLCVFVCVGDRLQSESSLAHAARGLSVPSSLLLCSFFSSSFPLISFSSHPLPSEASDKVSLYNRSQGQVCSSRLFSLCCVDLSLCIFLLGKKPIV